MRMTSDDADRFLPALRRAADVLSEIEDESRLASYGSRDTA